MASDTVLQLLYTQTWQVTLLAVAVWILVGIFASDRPHLAHCLWALVLLKCVMPPIWSSPTGAFSLARRMCGASGSVADVDRPPVHRELTGSEGSPRLEFWLKPEPRAAAAEPEAAAAGLTASEAEPADAPAARLRWGWQASVVAIWLIGSLTGLCVTVGRSVLFWHWLHRQNHVADSALPSHVQRLRRTLRIRRHVRILIVDAPVGPAVTGLLRPMIVLPRAIVAGRSEAEIRPLLAHELVHVRRGDLWWAALQSLATGICWFHPLVWFAARMLSRESERSCDEETIASLGCSPASYARCLLDVLEKKYLLRVAPALPGVRPVDVTASRMERIMRLGQGSHRRNPWWAALVLIVGGVTVLPGAAWVVAQEAGAAITPAVPLPAPEAGAIYPQPVAAAAKPSALPMLPPDAEAAEYQLQSHDVSDLLEKLIDIGIPPDEAPARLMAHVPPAEFWDDGKPTTPQGVSLTFRAAGHGVCKLGGGEPLVKVIGNRLYVFGGQQHRRQVRDVIQHLRQNGFGRLSMQIQLLTIPDELMASLDVEWTIAGAMNASEPQFDEQPASVVPATFAAGSNNGAPLIQPATGRPLSTPVLSCVLSERQAKALLNQAQRHPRTNVLSRPRIMLPNGQEGLVSVSAERPFVTGMLPPAAASGGKAHQPVVTVVSEGTSMELKPLIRPDGISVELSFAMQHSEIRDVDTVSFKRPGGNAGETLTLEVPNVVRQILRTKADLVAGSTLAVSGAKVEVGGRQAVLLALVTCEILDHSPPQAPALPPGHVNADLPAPSIPDLPLPASEEANAQPNHVVEIHASGEGTPRDFTALVSALAECGIAAKVTGDVEFQIGDDRIVVRGKRLRIRDGREPGDVVQADSGELVLERSTRHISGTLQGGVKLEFGDIQMSADEVIFTDSEVRLTGDAKVLDGNGHFQGQRVTWNLNVPRLTFVGEARMSRPSADGPPLVFRADRIEWNPHTNEILSSGRP